MIARLSLLFFFILIAIWAHAQSESSWHRVDTSIIKKRNLQDLRRELFQWRQQAVQQQDYNTTARCYYYLMAIADRTTEDTLFFQNALFMDSILSSGQSPMPLKAIIHVLKAKRIAIFRDRYFHNQKKHLFGHANYRDMSLGALDSAVDYHFEKALENAGSVTEKKLSWLASDPNTFLFEPALADIIYAEQIHTAGSRREVAAAKFGPSWLQLSQDAFIQLDSIPAVSGQSNIVFGKYKQWLRHQSTNPQAYYFIETLARKYFFKQLSSDSLNNHLYEQYLQSLLASPHDPVKAHAVYQSCLLWNEEARQYNSFSDYNSIHYISGEARFDERYRLHYVKAMDLFRRHAGMLANYPAFNKLLSAMAIRMQEIELGLTMDDNVLPGKPMLAALRFRNAKNIYVRTIRFSHNESALHADKERNIDRLLGLPYLRDTVIALKTLNDFQLHQSFIKMGPLPAGRYIILYSDSAISSENMHIDYLDLDVTRIAAINNDNRIFVLDRETGFPLTGAQVSGFAKGKVQAVNNEGYVTVNVEDDLELTIRHKGDTIYYFPNVPGNYEPQDIYDKDEYLDLLEYYEENTRLHIFTDRAIYRPGQTVHYKGIFMVRHPRTGEQLVLNWKNLKFPFFKKLYYKLARTFTGRKLEVYVNDPFGNERDTLFVLPDKFGAIAGSFKIPADAATGEWNFETYDVDFDDDNDGVFRVEEYKRPTFEIKLEKPTGDLRLGDSFFVKTKVRSFAGAQLNNMLVYYTVTASGSLPGSNSEYKFRNETIIDDEAYTDANGELLIKIVDSLIPGLKLSADRKWSMRYSVEVEVVDATGESHAEKGTYELTTRPVIFDMIVPGTMERNELPSIYIVTKTDFAGFIKKAVNVKIYRVHSAPAFENNWPSPDVYLYDSLELLQWFPELHKTVVSDIDKLIYETNLMASDTARLSLPAAVFAAGNYRMEITAIENEKIIGEITRRFSVFDKALADLPDSEGGFDYLPFNNVRAGEKFAWYTGSRESNIYTIYHAAWYEKNGNGNQVKYHYTLRPEKKGLNQWEFRIPERARDRVTITHLYIINNQLYRKTKVVWITATAVAQPEIIVEKYRSKLEPGAKETFTVSIKTKNANVLAQLMTTMYDATLDKLQEHAWHIPDTRLYYHIDNNWDYSIAGRVGSKMDNVWRTNTEQYGYRDALWWLNPLDYGYGTGKYIDSMGVLPMLAGRVAGVTITDTRSLDEAVVVGYSTVKRNMSGAVVSIRGMGALNSYKNTLVVLDGVIFEGDLSAINPNSITQGIILKGADATAIYGSRAAGGVLLLSTKGPVQLPEPPQAPAPVIRKNFAETAFFYPRIYADHKGIYTIQFTLSESVTTWKWKMLAHTKKAAFTYAEKTVVSQLPLMVQPDMPRFLYQGDKIVLKSRISNLDTADCTGQLECRLEDMVTGEDITHQLIKTSRKDFAVARSSNSTGSFEIQVPENLLHPLHIRITAQSKSYGDGEEHVIPILTKKILVSQSVPVVMNDQQPINIPKPSLPADAAPYGMSLFIAPQPQAALINSLPWLANYPYGCAEQTFNKMLAHAIAVSMVRTNVLLQLLLAHKAFTKSSGAAPGELPEESMPWLQLNHRHALQQQQLAKLFDTVQAKASMQKLFDELMKSQNSDGGITWFPGGKSNDYISTYLLAGFGKLIRDELPLPDERLTEYMRFIKKLIDYCDAIQYEYKHDNLFYLYARSFWTQSHAMPPARLKTADSLLAIYWQTQNNTAVGSAAMLVIASLRILPKENTSYARALQCLESLRQSAIQDEKNGIRWKTFADADDLNMLTEEWVVKTAEAFEEDINDTRTVRGIITWLLKTRSENNWSTTKSTADAISLLHRKQDAFIARASQLEASVNDTTLKVTNDLLSGNLFAFAGFDGKTFPQQIAVSGQSAEPQEGGINYYYFTADPPAEKTASGVKIVKLLTKFNSNTSAWEPVSPTTELKPGDRLTTTLTITTDKQLQYVFIDEKRAAACEPADAQSGYEYGKGISYYMSVRDIGYQFFADRIPAGISEISYETVVAKTGRFTCGPAALQCMYRPDIKAYSNSLHIEVKE